MAVWNLPRNPQQNISTFRKKMLWKKKSCKTQKGICKISQKFSLTQYKNLAFPSVYLRLSQNIFLTMYQPKLSKAKIIHTVFQFETEMILLRENCPNTDQDKTSYLDFFHTVFVSGQGRFHFMNSNLTTSFRLWKIIVIADLEKGVEKDWYLYVQRLWIKVLPRMLV